MYIYMRKLKLTCLLRPEHAHNNLLFVASKFHISCKYSRFKTILRALYDDNTCTSSSKGILDDPKTNKKNVDITDVSVFCVIIDKITSKCFALWLDLLQHMPISN
ncbi:hypothetical protein RF11_00281 [Thelohanellus kitauei]|uniref:Uncharacterized protein n=1 Tax=Thelohanellus kitauei TaxID=669202 RepID=A0A0C2MU82_THEKT|nr:hypothetical protein RF11_00281 [Thelohanellus kitauei]